jgi:hypothetical protein
LQDIISGSVPGNTSINLIAFDFKSRNVEDSEEYIELQGAIVFGSMVAERVASLSLFDFKPRRVIEWTKLEEKVLAIVHKVDVAVFSSSVIFHLGSRFPTPPLIPSSLQP